MRIFFTISILSLFFIPDFASAATCGLNNTAYQADKCNRGEVGNCKRKIIFNGHAIVFSERLRVNTDGNIRSYSAKDPAGSICANLGKIEDPYKNSCAMNTVCNGVHIRYKNGNRLYGFKTNDYGKGNCPKLITEFKRIKKAKWQPKDGSYIHWGSVIRAIGNSGHKKRVPCIIDNFLVSMASAKSGLKRKNRCDQAYYLDADVPSVVAPVCWSKSYRNKNKETCKKYLTSKSFPDVRPGDFAVVRLRSKPSKVIYAIVGDNGPRHKLGEASVGLHWRLRGNPSLPRTKSESYALDINELFDVIIFPGTRPNKLIITPKTFIKMQSASKKKFLAWGGNIETKAIKKLADCGLNARPNPKK